MSIHVHTIHSEISAEINRLNSQFDQSVNAIDKDAAFNKAKDYILQNYAKIAERSKILEEHLREIEIPDVALTATTNQTLKYTSFTLPSNYYMWLDVSASATSLDGVCTDNIWNVSYKQHKDGSLNNPMWAPSWEWRAGLFNLSSLGLMFYHNSEYTLNKVSLTYIKNIEDIAAPSLTTKGAYLASDGTILTEDNHLEVSSTALWRKMCEIAAFYILERKGAQGSRTLEAIMFNETTSLPLQKL